MACYQMLPTKCILISSCVLETCCTLATVLLLLVPGLQFSAAALHIRIACVHSAEPALGAAAAGYLGACKG